MNNGQQIITCKACGSNKVQDQGGKGASIATSIVMISFGMWIPIIGWFLMIPAGLVMLIFNLVTLGKKPTHRKFKCRECKHISEVSIETFKEYQSFLKG